MTDLVLPGSTTPRSQRVLSLLGLIAVFLLIGFFYPGSGADVLDWKPTRSPELEAENEVDDVAQMIAAQNEMRRRRGARERSGFHQRIP